MIFRAFFLLTHRPVAPGVAEIQHRWRGRSGVVLRGWDCCCESDLVPYIYICIYIYVYIYIYLVGGFCVSQEAPKHVPPSCTSSNADAAILFAALWHGVLSPIGFEATKGLQYLNPKLHVTMWKICWKSITNTPPGFFPWGRNHFAKFVTRVLKFPREWSSLISFSSSPF